MEGPRMAEKLRLTVNGESVEVEVFTRSRDRVSFAFDGRSYEVAFEDVVASSGAKPQQQQRSTQRKTRERREGEEGASVPILAPMPGIVLEVLVDEGSEVAEGDILVRIEAMKMENNVFAPISGVVSKVYVEAGSEVGNEALLVELCSPGAKKGG